MSLPAGPMVTLATALEARYTLLPRDGASREVAAIDFVTGNHANVLQPGELSRNIHIPARALAQALCLAPLLAHPSRPLRGVPHRHAERRRSDLLLTITAATPRPVQINFDRAPTAAELRHAIDEAFPPTAISTMCMARRPIGGGSPTTTPSRSVPSSPSGARHEFA